MSRLGRGCRARQCMANAGGAKGQMVLIGIPDMLDCVPVLVPLRSLLLYSHHMPSQNKMRLRPHSCMLKILRPAHRAKQLTKAPLRSVRFLTRCPLVMSLNRRCRQQMTWCECEAGWCCKKCLIFKKDAIFKRRSMSNKKKKIHPVTPQPY